MHPNVFSDHSLQKHFMLYSTVSTLPPQHGIAPEHITALITWLKVPWKKALFSSLRPLPTTAPRWRSESKGMASFTKVWVRVEWGCSDQWEWRMCEMLLSDWLSCWRVGVVRSYRESPSWCVLFCGRHYKFRGITCISLRLYSDNTVPPVVVLL